ncbi:MAG: V-type ATP synthase subunit I [Clostridiales bacterium GWF2_36_10]|nr:MAG: V-type ATP synthase subunit I [Clostridiales bacterium GWF2_36_10]HAN21998.1 V-type ATP synthase subunit I [Clostridiales bacterium]
MAVLPMQRITICALKKDRKKILEQLQRRGVIEIDMNLTEDNIFRKNDVSAAITVLNKNIATAKEALQILDSYVPIKKSMLGALNGRLEITPEEYDKFSLKHTSVENTTNKICMLVKQISEQKAEILKLKATWEMLYAWTTLDIPMNFSGTKYTSGFIGTLPNIWDLDSIYALLAEQMPINVDIISASREQTCIFVLCVKEKAQIVSEKLRAAGFSYASSTIDKAPAKQREDLENQIKQAENNITKAISKIETLVAQREDIRFFVDYETIRAEKYNVINQLSQSKNTFIMTGYIPEKEKSIIETELSSNFELALEFEQPKENEDVPVKLENNGFSAPLEGIVESYSLPGKSEIDPTTVMSLFYYMLFGLMLSDAVYGAVITLGCAFGLFFYRNKLENSMRNTLKMFFFCGISTVFWGVMFGSYLGDIVDVVSSTYFGKVLTIPPFWFFPVKEPMRMLVFAMLIGIIHLFSGLGMKLYQLFKQKDYKAIIYDVVFWYVLIFGCILKLLSMKMFADILGLKFILPSLIGNIAGIIAVVAAVGIITTNGRESKNPFKRFLKGLYALYGITGYLSDVLSYSRLLALGLATGVIASVINKMASMTSSLSIIGVVLFIIILLLGHTLNIGINLLGAYVHTNRLQYVEFFGKFYSGGSRKFNPFSVKTKYYKFKEE